jgi:hypothetical protein
MESSALATHLEGRYGIEIDRITQMAPPCRQDVRFR